MAEHATAGKMEGLVKRLKRSGIEDSFVQSLEEEVTPGTSALFLLSEHERRLRMGRPDVPRGR